MRRAQTSGAPAAALIIVIMAFLLIFVLFLPEEDRNRLLNPEDEDGSVAGKKDGRVLLLENPGTITKLSEREFEHNIPAFNVFTEKEDAIIKSTDSIFIESSGVETKVIPFFIKEPSSDVKLTFTVHDMSGRLAIDFNGDEIFKGEIDGFAGPFSLDKVVEDNVILFSVDKPQGWQFWKNNFYDIRDIKVSGIVERLNNREAINTFSLSQEEADPENLESVYLIYLVDCSVANVGRLSVYLNGNLLSSKVPDCGSLEKTFIDPIDLVRGRNELKFSAQAGKYLIDQVFVKTKLEKPIFPVYFFDINSTMFRRIDNNTINSTVSLEFIDSSERKNAIIEINQHRISVDTRAKVFSKNIDPFVIEGSNSLRITPQTTLQVLELRVDVDCKGKSCS